MKVFNWYFIIVKSYIQLLLCVYGIYFAATYIFQRFIKSQRGFSNAGAGSGYTFYPVSLNTLRRLVNDNGKRVYKTILLLEITYSFPCQYILNSEKLFKNCYLSEPVKLYRLMIVRDSYIH